MKKFSLAYYIFEKDFTESLKNKTVLFSILFPVILSFIFSIVLKPKEISRLNLAVIDHGSSKIVKILRTMAATRSELKIFEQQKLENAKKQLRTGVVQAILVFPSDFDKQIDEGKNGKIDFWVGESGLKSSQILKNELNKVIYYCSYKKTPPDFFRLRSLYGKEYSPIAAMIPTWILFTIIGGYMVVSSSIMEEKEKKTLDAILITPCRMSEIVMGKGLLGIVLITLGSTLILALNKGFTGNIPGIIILTFLGAIVFSLMGVLVGLIFPNQTSVSTFGSLLFLLMFMPVAMAPASEKMRGVAKLLPSYYIQNGINDSMFAGVNFADLTFHITYLVIFIAALFIANLLALRKKME